MHTSFIPRTASGIALLALLAACGETPTGNTPTDNTPPAPPTTGSIAVSVATTGVDLDSDGYVVKVDGVSKGPITPNGSRTVVDVAAGARTVTIEGISVNCAAASPSRSVTVTAGAATNAAFSVSCAANVGTVMITTSTTGLVLDPDGYQVALNGGGATAIGINATTTVQVPTGAWSLALTGQAANCSPVGEPQVSGSVSFGETATAQVDVVCFRDPIVFIAEDQGQPRVAVIDASGGPMVYMTPAGGITFLTSPTRGSAWNPARTHLMYHRTPTQDFSAIDLNVVALNKSEHWQLSRPGFQTSGVWSPDGSKIVFVGEGTNGAGDLFVADANLTSVQALTTTAGLWEGGPTWSPDGTMIAYQANEAETGSKTKVFVMQANGSGAVSASDPAGTNPDNVEDVSPVWSPDGTQLAFERFTGGVTTYNLDIWAVNADGTGLTQLTATPTERETIAIWAPDGSAIWFQQDDATFSYSHLARVSPVGGPVTTVVNDGINFLGSWRSPTTFDGPAAGPLQVAVTRINNNAPFIATYNADGTGGTVLVAGESPHWR